MNCVYVTLEHKTSQFLEIEIYTSTKSWKSGIWGCKKNYIEKIAFNVVQIKFNMFWSADKIIKTVPVSKYIWTLNVYVYKSLNINT